MGKQNKRARLYDEKINKKQEKTKVGPSEDECSFQLFIFVILLRPGLFGFPYILLITLPVTVCDRWSGQKEERV